MKTPHDPPGPPERKPSGPSTPAPKQRPAAAGSLRIIDGGGHRSSARRTTRQVTDAQSRGRDGVVGWAIEDFYDIVLPDRSDDNQSDLSTTGYPPYDPDIDGEPA